MSDIDKRLATEGKLQYHLKMKRGDVGKYVLLPGDRARVPMMSAYLEGACVVGFYREFVAHSGTH